MRKNKILAVIFVLAVASIPALAGGYDSFSRGVDANNIGEDDVAIASFSDAISAGDLAPSYLPSALAGRARAYLQKERCVPAAADLDQAIALKPDYVDAYVLRANARACLSGPAAALKDITAAINLRPAAPFYFQRARLLWGVGDFPHAATDAAQATAIDPRNPYILLWTGIVEDRMGRLDRDKLSRGAASFNAQEWPTPLLGLYSGAATPDDVYRAVALGNSTKAMNERRCEADFYVGEWQLTRRNAAAAAELFKTAIRECPHDFIAFEGARQELTRLQ